MQALLNRIRSWLRQSPRLHVRQQAPADLRSMVALIDRFVDGSVKYPLEWDDFISWEHAIPSIERFRVRIAALEPLLFSTSVEDRRGFFGKLLIIRNEAAALVGLAGREIPNVV